MEERMNLVAQGLQNKDLMVSDTINEMEIILKEM